MIQDARTARAVGSWYGKLLLAKDSAFEHAGISLNRMAEKMPVDRFVHLNPQWVQMRGILRRMSESPNDEQLYKEGMELLPELVRATVAAMSEER